MHRMRLPLSSGQMANPGNPAARLSPGPRYWVGDKPGLSERPSKVEHMFVPFALAKPEVSDHPVDVGLRTEAAILSELIKRGHKVLVPFGVNQRYDLVLDVDGEFLRAQCKTGRLRHGGIRFSTRSVLANRTQISFRNYDGEADVFLVYCSETDGIYVVPVEAAPKCEMCLRVEPSLNGQSSGIRLASDYELPG